MSDELKLTLAGAAGSEISGFPPAASATPVVAGSRVPIWVSMTALMLFLGHLPLLVSYGMGLMSREPYQFAPLAVVAAFFLAWHRLQLLSSPLAPGSARVALALIATAFCALCVATFKWSPWLGVISALLTALAVVWALGGIALVKAWFPALLMLIILVRPPLGLDSEFTLALRGLAVKLSSCLLDQLSVPHYLAGNVVESVNQRFLVEEACSGINSVLFVGAFSLFYTLWRCRPWGHILGVLVAAISFVLLGNVFRITVGVMLSYRYDIDLLSGWRHQTLGFALLFIYLGMAASADAFLNFLMLRGYSTRGTAAGGPTGTIGESVSAIRKLGSQMAQSSSSFGPHLALAIGATFSLLALAQTGRAFLHQSEKQPAAVSSLRGWAKFAVPEQVGDWKRVDRKQRNVTYLELRAIYSEVWAFQNGRMVAFVALDYPYPGLHDLTLCYFNQGWNVNVGAKAVKVNDAAGKRQDYFEVEMKRKPMSSGYLLFGGFTEDGQWAGKDFNRVIQNRISNRQPVTYQVQVLTATYAALTSAEKQQMLQLFQEMRHVLSQQVLAQLKREP